MTTPIPEDVPVSLYCVHEIRMMFRLQPSWHAHLCTLVVPHNCDKGCWNKTSVSNWQDYSPLSLPLQLDWQR